MNSAEANQIAARETAAIQQVVKRARFRIRLQGAMEGVTTAIILAAALALVAVFAMRIGLVGSLTGVVMLCLVNPILIAGALFGAFKKVDDETIARKIDRASNLSDRLSTAIAFRRALATTAPADASVTESDETIELMVAAIRDGVRATPRANVKAATPFTLPKDLKAAAGFVIVSMLAAGLALPQAEHAPRLIGAFPDQGPPGTEVDLRGEDLMIGLSPATAGLGTPFVPQDAQVYIGPEGGGRPIQVLDWQRESIHVKIPADAPFGETKLMVYIGKTAVGPVPFVVLDPKNPENFKPDSVVLDADERAYVESILAQLKELAKREHIEDLDKFIAKIEQLLKDADQGKITKEQLLAELAKAEELLNAGKEPDSKEIAKQLGEMGKDLQKSELTKELGKALEKQDLDKAKQEMEELARKLDKSALEKQIEELEKKLQDPKLTDQQKKDLQKKLDEAKKELNEKQEELKKLQDELKKQEEALEKQQQELKKKQDEIQKQLEQNKDKLTEQQKKDLENKLKELQKQQQEAQKQQQELKQQEQQLQKQQDALKQEKPMTEQQKQELQKQLEQVSKKMEQQQQKDQQQQQQQAQKLQDEIRRLQKQRDQAKNEQERLNAERQLQKKKDELQKLDKDNQEKEQSEQRQALKRLQRDMQKAAEQLQKPQKQESQDQKDERERQASRKLKDAARETGKVDQDQRKQASQKKMSSQMDDLREALRRAKQKGQNGKDPFGRNAKNDDFGKRAKGQKGNGQSWKPGGQQQGQQNGGQAKGAQQGQEWGVGHEEDMTDTATDKSGKTKDVELEAKNLGKNGGSRRETILAAAQKGFAREGYRDVYQQYQKIVEDVMRNEKLPSSYKYYVKRYFARIHPTGEPLKETNP